MAQSFTLPQPQGLKFTDWSALVAEQLAQFGVSAATHEDAWKSWVCALFYVPDLVALNIPSPEQFQDWQVWADRFVDSVG